VNKIQQNLKKHKMWSDLNNPETETAKKKKTYKFIPDLSNILNHKNKKDLEPKKATNLKQIKTRNQTQKQNKHQLTTKAVFLWIQETEN
jgi:hypothetical protein